MEALLKELQKINRTLAGEAAGSRSGAGSRSRDFDPDDEFSIDKTKGKYGKEVSEIQKTIRSMEERARTLDNLTKAEERHLDQLKVKEDSIKEFLETNQLDVQGLRGQTRSPWQSWIITRAG